MGYSKIESIEILNFMSFKKAKLVFDETGIINIKGYNDSGKSAILRALAVCLMDKYRSKQAKFIRHGEDYFRVVVNFDDGVSILRDKYITGQSLYEVYKDGECVFTTKQGNKLARIDGVPKVIEDYLGLCVTDSIYLNYQSNEDKLPFVDSTGSENYQAFHEVLRMEEIFRANNMINTDKNTLGSEINEIEVDIQRDEVLLERCGDVSKELIDELTKLEKEAEVTNDRKNKLSTAHEIVGRIEKIPNIPIIEKIPCGRLNSLEGLKSIISNYESVPQIPKIDKVDSRRLEVLINISKYMKALEGYKEIPSIPKVNESLVTQRKQLNNIIGIFQSYIKCSQETNDIVKQINSNKERLDSLVKEAESQGLQFVKCENCGAYTVVGGHSHGV